MFRDVTLKERDMNYVGTESIQCHKSLHTKRLQASLGSPCWQKKFVGGWIGRTMELMDLRTKLVENTRGFEVPTMLLTKIQIFWDVMPCKILRGWLLMIRDIYFLHLQGFGTPKWLITSIDIALPLFNWGGVKIAIPFNSSVFLHSVLLKEILRGHVSCDDARKDIILRGGADKSLARSASRCRRTESIMSLERGVCSCAELQFFSSFIS